MREATERVGSKKSRAFSDPEKAARFPPKVVYTFHQIMSDLLFFSASHLHLGGRLVTWIPVFRLVIIERSPTYLHVSFSF